MASALGHVLGAEAALGLFGRIGPEPVLSKRGMWVAAAVAVIPELEAGLYVVAGEPGWLEPVAHFSHTLLQAGVLGILAAPLCLYGQLGERSAPDKLWAGLRAIIVFALVAAGHQLIDWLSVKLPQPLFWPWSDSTFVSPVQLVPSTFANLDSWGEVTRAVWSWRGAVGLALETIIFLPLAVLGLRKGLAPPVRWTLAAVSVAGMATTYILYQFTGKL